MRATICIPGDGSPQVERRGGAGRQGQKREEGRVCVCGGGSRERGWLTCVGEQAGGEQAVDTMGQQPGCVLHRHPQRALGRATGPGAEGAREREREG